MEKQEAAPVAVAPLAEYSKDIDDPRIERKKLRK
jgi:hypothetical protein